MKSGVKERDRRNRSRATGTTCSMPATPQLAIPHSLKPPERIAATVRIPRPRLAPGALQPPRAFSCPTPPRSPPYSHAASAAHAAKPATSTQTSPAVSRRRANDVRGTSDVP